MSMSVSLVLINMDISDLCHLNTLHVEHCPVPVQTISSAGRPLLHSGILRLATPIFGISNISNFNHYKMPHFLKDACYTFVSLYQMFVQ